MSVIFKAQPGGHLQGHIRVPGDKSISHRSIILSALAEGSSEIKGFLQGEDNLNTLKAFQAMGVKISDPNQEVISVTGVGMKGLKKPEQELDMGNSGTAMRLMTGLLAAQSFDSVLIGDESLSKRPMKRIITPLSQMGAVIEATEKGTSPLHIKGQESLQGIDYTLPVASAQVKSAILLAGLFAKGKTSVTEPAPTRDHTERMLQSFGYTVIKENNKITLEGGGKLSACNIDIPADISSSAFFMVGACIAENSEIILQHVGMNPTRTGVIEILKLMQADIEIIKEYQVGSEPVADLRIKSSKLKGIDIPEHLVPLAIDEFPVLFIAAACAEGQTRLTGAEELRVKESDRIQVMADGLITLGIDAKPTADGIVIQGGSMQGGEIESEGDHRIAMAFSIAALRAEKEIIIKNCQGVATSFPNFVTLAETSGLTIQVN